MQTSACPGVPDSTGPLSQFSKPQGGLHSVQEGAHQVSTFLLQTGSRPEPPRLAVLLPSLWSYFWPHAQPRSCEFTSAFSQLILPFIPPVRLYLLRMSFSEPPDDVNYVPWWYTGQSHRGDMTCKEMTGLKSGKFRIGP